MQMLKVSEAAKALRITTHWLRVLLRTGQIDIPFQRLPGARSRLLIRKDDLDRYLTKGMVTNRGATTGRLRRRAAGKRVD